MKDWKETATPRAPRDVASGLNNVRFLRNATLRIHLLTLIRAAALATASSEAHASLSPALTVEMPGLVVRQTQHTLVVILVAALALSGALLRPTPLHCAALRPSVGPRRRCREAGGGPGAVAPSASGDALGRLRVKQRRELLVVLDAQLGSLPPWCAGRCGGGRGIGCCGEHQQYFDGALHGNCIAAHLEDERSVQVREHELELAAERGGGHGGHASLRPPIRALVFVELPAPRLELLTVCWVC
mmetsp:Transcript_114407/g.363617  ORF Transcript_114407/g.363617 Transcript_114407/m.363617 type:complete len:244 (+) Transcript_114407:145-876(+)